ncbi:hypothetical protein [Streptomyces sp. NPDC005408]|uniref:hypothetical protein n=1 Tax=Streptomyces sp. NPDC005408 TaxID=3155341 RepID=UPI0033AFE828
MSNGGRGAQLQASARGWLTVQLAVLGFVGLCGALKGGGSSSAPRAVEAAAGVLILVALVVACWATYLVARTAWPLLGRADDTDPEGETEVQLAGRRLRMGLVLTFLAVAMVATATTSSWWPAEAESGGSAGLVRVATSEGTLCGTLASGDDGAVRLQVEGQTVDIPLGRIAALDPAAACT